MNTAFHPNRWSLERAEAWHKEQPYYVGANFIPSNAINQLEMWQEDTFSPELIRRELGFAAGLGMNAMRVYLHDLLWQQDPNGFCERIDAYLGIADELGIRTVFVLFDDCWNPNFSLGAQPSPKPYTHNSGWVQSPGRDTVLNSDQWPRLESYVKGILSHFRDDQRIVLWDLYNEPGNGSSGDDTTKKDMLGERSLPLLMQVFAWAREIEGLRHPITTGVWNVSTPFHQLNDFSLANSDIISFHCYGPPEALQTRIIELQAWERPLICTEYMARTNGSTFEGSLPVLSQYDVGAIHWGLVAGKTQTIYPWNWSEEKGPPEPYFHDVFHPNGDLLVPEEEVHIRRATKHKAVKQLVIGI